MALKITTPPTGPDGVVSLAEFRQQSGQDGIDADDVLVRRLIAAVTAWLAGPQGWLGRSLMEQTLTLTVPLDAVQAGIVGIVLPRPPFIAVDSVAILDAAGAAITISPAGYTTADGDDGLTRLVFTTDFRTPVLPAGPAFLRTVYRAGYGPTPEDVDPGLRHAILMAVMRLYAGRGDPTMTLNTDPMMADLFAPYRVWTVA